MMEAFALDKILPGRDLTALQPWLRQKLGGADVRIVEAQTPKTGFSAITLLLTLDIMESRGTHRRRVALRLEQPGHQIFLDTDLCRQGEMMMALAARGILAPTVIGIEPDRVVLGGQFIVTTMIEGRALPQQPSYQVAGLLRELDEAGRRRMWLSAVRGIAQINRLDWRDGFGFLNRIAYGAPGLGQYLGWLQAWHDEARGGTDHPVLDHAMAFLRREQPETDDAAVLWGDSNAGNMLFAGDGQLAGVLDFEAAALGPGEVDLGWWFYMDEMLSFGVERLPGLPGRAEQIAAYEAERGRAVRELDYYEVLAGVRMALVMVRTVARLVSFGTLPAATQAAQANPIVEVLARRLGVACTPTGADYMAMVGAMNTR